jgi:predicted deacetylase
MHVLDIKVGDIVAVIEGGPHFGAYGLVIEETMERLRVYWHTGKSRRKRTWVRREVVARVTNMSMIGRVGDSA